MTPLMGKNASPHNNSLYISLIITVVFWIAASVCSVVLKPFAKKVEYETVQIVLNSTPIEEKVETDKIEEAAADAPAPELPVEETLSEPEPVQETIQEVPAEPVKPRETPKTEPSKPKTDTKKSETKTTKTTPVQEYEKFDWDSYDYATDLTDGFDFSYNQTAMADEVVPEKPKNTGASTTNTPQPHKITTQSGFEGSAAEQTDYTPQTSNTKTPSKDESATGATSDMLKRIQNTTFTNDIGSTGTKTQSKVKTTNDGDTVSVAMTDGTTRKLLEPKTPAISLSAEAAALIDSSREVNISFSVGASGKVSSIKITPESILPERVRSEIITQLMSWQFESSSSSATASFEYSIIKK